MTMGANAGVSASSGVFGFGAKREAKSSVK